MVTIVNNVIKEILLSSANQLEEEATNKHIREIIKSEFEKRNFVASREDYYIIKNLLKRYLNKENKSKEYIVLTLRDIAYLYA